MDIQEINERASRIELIALDNDGVLTDGRVYINTDGIESKAFDIRDGFGIVLARRAGLKFVIITGLKSPIVEVRAKMLHIDEVHQGFVEKDDVLRDILKKHNLSLEQAAFMGDDLFDLPALRIAGLSAAPADAHPGVKAEVHWVSSKRGGRGAVRELSELIVKARGQWESMMDVFA